MPTFAFKFPGKSTTRESSKKSERKRPCIASRLQSVFCSTRDLQSREAEDSGDAGIPIDSPLPLQVPPIISDQPLVNRGNGQSREARGEVDPVFPIETEATPVATETPLMDRGNAQSRETRGEVDPVFPIETEATPVATETSLMDRVNAQSREARGGVDPVFQTETEATPAATETPLITMFQGSSNFQIKDTKITAIGGDATIIQFGDGQFTEVQRNLICDYIATLAALPDINANLKKHALITLVINLPRAEAVFNDYQNKKKSGPCFDGTRVALLREMANWATGTDESRMYILSGLAGIGKSTVAYTIASRAADLNLLGASFFFSRDEADRNNAKKLFTTIAYQLCVYNETFATAIGDVLLTERGSAATTKNPQEQLQVLILDPLQNIVQSRARPTLIIVDALDECDKDDVAAVVKGLSQLVRDLPSFKVILTTRPLPYFDDFLVNQGSHKLFHLQDIEDKVVDSDIKLYLKHNLSLERVSKRFRRRKWCASDEQIDILVRAAGRLFIIASTAVRYILDEFVSNPAAQMEELLRASAQDHTPFKDLDDFYTIILRNVVPANCDNQIILSRYKSIVGAIVCVSRPLPVSTLAHLIDMDVEDIHVVLEKLQSVILLGDDDVAQIYHKSFPDYLTNEARCKDLFLQIDPKIGHTQMAKCCFDITNKHLKYNILSFGNVARFMPNEDGFKEDRITDERLQEKIQQHLRYACVYWANHLEVANIEDTELMNRLEKFVDEHTLHWLEVLSLVGNLDLAHRAIRIVIKLLKSTSSDLNALLSDALRFISKFYDIIERSALHTYYSALPFSPTDSLLYRQYIREAKDKICCIEGGAKKWDAVVAVLNPGTNDHVIKFKFSLDSTRLISCSKHQYYKPGKLKIWDAATGTPISTIPGERFAVTDDFSTVASSSDDTITFYNVNGSTNGTMITTSSRIEALELSESSRVAAALSDGTVWLWDSRKAELICNFDGFQSSRYPSHREPPLRFCPTGATLVYSSANAIATLVNGSSGTFIANLPCGVAPMFEFFADGSRIACLSRNGLTLWNTESGGLVSAVEDVNHRVLVISANGSLLASADHYNSNVTLWSANRDHLAELKVLELGGHTIRSMAFSLDNILAIGIKADAIKLYDTNTHSFISTLSFSGLPEALAFSLDCTHLACGNDSGTVYLWNMREIDTSSPPSHEATVVTAIALSRDCSRLACGFQDGTVELWETSPTKRRITSHQCGSISTVEFGPDGRLFASGSDDGTIKLWNGEDGSLHGTLIISRSRLEAVALSNSVLIAAKGDFATLWSLDTLSVIDTFLYIKYASTEFYKAASVFTAVSTTTVSTVSISDDSAFAAIVEPVATGMIFLIDVVNRTTIAAFYIPSTITIFKLTSLSDNSQFVAQTDTGDFLLPGAIKQTITNGPTLIQLPDTPLWHGVPLRYCWTNEQHCFSALFPGHQDLVPVLWIPKYIRVTKWTQGSSMIALACEDGRIILLRLPTSHDH